MNFWDSISRTVSNTFDSIALEGASEWLGLAHEQHVNVIEPVVVHSRYNRKVDNESLAHKQVLENNNKMYVIVASSILTLLLLFFAMRK